MLAMTNKLVVIINSLKVPKIKKILLYEIKFLVPNYSCLQNPWLGGYRPRPPFSLSSTEFVEPPPNKIPGDATVGSSSVHVRFLVYEVVLGKFFLQVLLFSPFSTIPPMLHAILHLYVAQPDQEGEACVPSRNHYFSGNRAALDRKVLLTCSQAPEG